MDSVFGSELCVFGVMLVLGRLNRMEKNWVWSGLYTSMHV